MCCLLLRNRMKTMMNHRLVGFRRQGLKPGIPSLSTSRRPRRDLSTAMQASSCNNDLDYCYYEQIPTDMEEMIYEYANKPPTPISLQTLMQTGRGYRAQNNNKNGANNNVYWGRLGQKLDSDRIVLQMATYLQHEMPVRLAHRIQDLDQVPFMRDMEAVQHVKGIYVQSFRDLVDAFHPTHSAIQTMEEEHEFATLLSKLYTKHAGVLVQMAQGAYQLREEIRFQQKDRLRRMNSSGGTGTTTTASVCTEEEFARMKECHQFLDRFYMSRIGIRFLAGQYLSLRSNSNNENSNTDPLALSQNANQSNHYIGMICRKTSPSACVRQAASDATMMCRRTYGRCPQVKVSGRLDLTFPYIPTYLHYILLELLKNALRATMEAHRDSDRPLPAVDVIIADGKENEDVVIKIADEGGGIKRSQVDKIWSYLFTTADPKIQKNFIVDNNSNQDHSKESPIAGLGYGLPISRSYCQYFGGDLDLISMEGYGTDAFVHLKRLGDSKEPVPV